MSPAGELQRYVATTHSIDMRFICAIALLAALSTSGAAQDSTPASRHYPTRPSAPSRGVHADYDPQYDKLVLQLDVAPLDESLGISALVALDGRNIRKEADGVVLTFWSVAPQKRFQQARAVTLSINDAPPIDLGAAYLQPNPCPGFTEILLKGVSLDQWLALAEAPAAKLTVGDLSYALSPELLAAIRDFASRMKPGT